MAGNKFIDDLLAQVKTSVITALSATTSDPMAKASFQVRVNRLFVKLEPMLRSQVEAWLAKPRAKPRGRPKGSKNRPAEVARKSKGAPNLVEALAKLFAALEDAPQVAVRINREKISLGTTISIFDKFQSTKAFVASELYVPDDFIEHPESFGLNTERIRTLKRTFTEAAIAKSEEIYITRRGNRIRAVFPDIQAAVEIEVLPDSETSGEWDLAMSATSRVFEVEVPADQFATLQTISHMASDDVFRPNLCGVAFLPSSAHRGRGNLVATDGHGLTTMTAPVFSDVLSQFNQTRADFVDPKTAKPVSDKPVKIGYGILPAKFIEVWGDAAKSAGSPKSGLVMFGMRATTTSWQYIGTVESDLGRVRIVLPDSGEVYPNFEAVIPKRTNRSFVQAGALLAGLLEIKNAEKKTKDSRQGWRLEKTPNADQAVLIGNKSGARVPITVDWVSGELQGAFLMDVTGKFLIPFLSALPKSSVVGFNQEGTILEPLLVESEDSLMILMPARI